MPPESVRHCTNTLPQNTPAAPVKRLSPLHNYERRAFLLHPPIKPISIYMYYTCDILLRMSKMIQIRNVPDDLHRKLKVQAAQAGMTLSDYLLSEIEQVAEKPTLSEMMERLRSREPVELDEPPEVTIRRMRDADDPRDLS
jgi:plasmid stability protein